MSNPPRHRLEWGLVGTQRCQTRVRARVIGAGGSSAYKSTKTHVFHVWISAPDSNSHLYLALHYEMYLIALLCTARRTVLMESTVGSLTAACK